MGHEDTSVGAGQRVDAEHRLVDEVLRDVRDETVLAHDHKDVLGSEDEPGQLAALNGGTAPLHWDGRGDGGERVLVLLVPGLDGLEAPGASGEEERCLSSGAVPGDELVILGASVHEDDPGCGHDRVTPGSWKRMRGG